MLRNFNSMRLKKAINRLFKENNSLFCMEMILKTIINNTSF